MKTCKDFERLYLGSSDISSLVMRGCTLKLSPEWYGEGADRLPEYAKVAEVHFGSDGDYSAYFVDEEAEVGAHYTKVLTATKWLAIYDDGGRVVEIKAPVIEVYRAGDFGIIVKAVNGDYKIRNGGED